jgi:flagellin
MSSILTNNSAMVALATLQNVNRGLDQTQSRVSTGLAIQSGKDNAAYFSISETMGSDSRMFQAINDGLTSTKNSVATARLGAERVNDLASQFAERVAFAQGTGVDLADVKSELVELVSQIQLTIDQSTFNGASLVDGTPVAVTAVTGISRANDAFSTTTISFMSVDLSAIHTTLNTIADDFSVGDPAALIADLETAEGALADSITAATSLGITEKTIESQQVFLSSLSDTIDSGVSSMVDANMEEEAARLQAYQVQQQLATQSLSIANQAPQNILSLFR